MGSFDSLVSQFRDDETESSKGLIDATCLLQLATTHISLLLLLRPRKIDEVQLRLPQYPS